MVNKVLQTDIVNLLTNGQSAATLVNDVKRAINQVIDEGGVTDTVPIEKGGTGGITAEEARTNLGAAKDQLASASNNGLISTADKVRLDNALLETLQFWEPTVTDGVIDVSSYPTNRAGKFYEISGLVSPAFFTAFNRTLDNGDVVPFDRLGVPTDLWYNVIGIAGQNYYLAAADAEEVGYKKFSATPCSCDELELSATIAAANTEYQIGQWITNGTFNVQTIKSGPWQFNLHINRTGGSSSSNPFIRAKVFELDGGIETELFSVISNIIEDSGDQFITLDYVLQNDITIDGKPLIVRLYAEREGGTSTDLSVFVGGNTRASYVETTLDIAILGINDIDGLPEALYPESKTANEVTFAAPAFHGDVTPLTGNITHDLTGANAGVEATIYHNDTTEPTYPAEWVKLGSGAYANSVLNTIIARYINSSRIEYVITQDA